MSEEKLIGATDERQFVLSYLRNRAVSLRRWAAMHKANGMPRGGLVRNSQAEIIEEAILDIEMGSHRNARNQMDLNDE